MRAAAIWLLLPVLPGAGTQRTGDTAVTLTSLMCRMVELSQSRSKYLMKRGPYDSRVNLAGGHCVCCPGCS
jgi:hypothetical protein